MIRQALIALGAISLVLGSQGIGLALNCPPHPEQTGKDWEGEVNAAVAKIGPVSGGEAKTKLKAVTQDLLGKLPDAGKIYLEQMKYATICSSIRDDKTLSESEKRKQMMEYDLEIQKAKERHSSGTKPQSKQSGKTKADGPQSIVSPPVPSITRADTKQPEMPKSHSAASQNPSISQQSAGANSPNIIGDKNSVIIMPPADKPSGQEPSDIQDEKLYIECEGKQIPQTTLSDRKVKGLAFSTSHLGAAPPRQNSKALGWREVELIGWSMEGPSSVRLQITELFPY